MAITQGHGNPDWTREETILALALYLQMEGMMASAKDSRVQQLSETLRRLPYHAVAARKPSFRNPAGVAFKLQNLRSVATGKGLGNVSNMDRQIWAEFGQRADELQAQADLITQAVLSLDKLLPETREDQFLEGRIITELHQRLERNSRLRARLLKLRRRKGPLKCEVCGIVAKSDEDIYEDAIFEAHHLNPLFTGERITSLQEMALLCANCHRFLHRMISHTGRVISLQEVRAVLI